MARRIHWNGSLVSRHGDGAAPAWGRVLLPCLFLGLLGGTLIGLYAPQASVRVFGLTLGAYAPAPRSFLSALWGFGAWFLALALCATSWAGAVPAAGLLLLAGFRLGCSVAALYAADRYAGLLEALLRYGLPALAVLPCLLLAAGGSLRASAELLRLRLGTPAPPMTRPMLPLWLLCAAASALCALYTSALLPLLLALTGLA